MRPSPAHHSPWLILGVILLASMAASINQFKVPPVLPLLMKAFSQTAGEAGLLMSAFAITGLILALPAGFIFQRLGFRVAGLLALLFLVLGSLTGALTRSGEIMLAGRFVEGAGMCFLSVVAPAVIALWFPPQQRGKAMGIWAVWVPLGSTLMFILAPPLAARWDWQGVWWFAGLYAAGTGILYWLAVAAPEGNSSPEVGRPPTGPAGRELGGVLRNPQLWLISFLFGCFNFAAIGFITWAPTFLHGVRGVPLAEAALRLTPLTILPLLSCPLAGWISDRIGSRKLISSLPLVFMAPLFLLTYGAGEEMILPLTIALGFLTGFVPTGVFAATADMVKDERLGGMAMAVIQIGQNSGMLLGPLVFGLIVESASGWPMAFGLLAPVSLLGAIAGWLAKIR